MLKEDTRAIASLDLDGDERVLEIGFGSGAGVRALMRRLPWGYVAGVDPSAGRVRRVKHRNRRFMRGGLIDVRCGDASELPWPDGRFDAVVSVEDVMLRNGLELALREVHRVLKDDGCVSIAVHERDWDPDFRARLTAALWNTDFVCVRSRRSWTLRGRTLFFTARAS